jgi:exosome complex RNA-binding protein Rrp4
VRRNAPPAPPKAEPLPEVRETVSPEAQKLADQLNRTIGLGDVVQATVERMTANDYECRVAGSQRPGRLPRDEVKGLKPGDSLRARVKRVAQSGAFILTVKGLPKE